MNINELYNAFAPLINVMGSLCLTALISITVLYAVFWILKKVWKVVSAVGVILACVFLVVLLFGGV